MLDTIACKNTKHQHRQNMRGAYLSPSMLLKSLTMAMPRPAIEYSTVRMVTSHESCPKRACKHPTTCEMMLP